MTKFIINGGKPLSGKVKVSGAKNAALPIMAGVILASEPVTLHNVPQLDDVETMAKMLESLSVKVERGTDGSFVFDASGDISDEPPYNLVSSMRAGFFVMGPLLSRLRRAKIPLPGGCAIGARPVDIHIKGFKAMGTEVSIEHGRAVAQAERLIGSDIMLSFPSVGATENLIMAAVLAEGTTVIRNAAKEPEIVDLSNFLNLLGAKISGAGTSIVTIKGVKSLGGGTYSVMPDRIEAGTFVILGAMAKGPVTVTNCNPGHIDALLETLTAMGATLEVGEDYVTVSSNGPLRAASASTMPYPGFATDLQAQLMAAMSIAEGTSIIVENIFENRFMHVSELVKMGASINIDNDSKKTAIIKGVPKLVGAPVSATDLRAGAAVVLAGLVAEGETEVSEIQHIDRGYEHLAERMSMLGADIKRID
ncbi:MAG: UDP-N-acetylglucosamine 1-carboxyvinyltransferase [Candidatus Riflebacteria bacterium]|nr:UDP-N-acetylglucosamine 1-carboxyvinyltransferase [Candidatus Riflebacteria bacterium]